MKADLSRRWDWLMNIADERHCQKQGYTSRNDMTGSSSDRIGVAGEAVVSALTRLPFDDSLRANGDPGWDFEHNGLTYDVKTSFAKARYLIEYAKRPKADILILVAVDMATMRGEPVCWATREQMLNAPYKDFGYGPRLALPVESLVAQGQRGLPPALLELYKERWGRVA